MIGVPGSGPRRLARRRAAAGAAAIACGVALAVAGVSAASPVLFVIGCSWVVIAWRAYRPLVARARAGADAERAVGAVLRRVPADLVAHGVLLPGRGGDLDVVVLGPMAAVVEVKRAEGRVSVRSDGTVRVAGRPVPGNPGRQSLGAAAALRRFLGETDHVDAILCVTGMRQRPRHVSVAGGELTVCSARHLRRVVRRLEPRLTPGQAARAIGRLRDI